MDALTIRCGDPARTRDVWFTQWTNSIAIPFPLLQTDGTAPKPLSHPLSYPHRDNSGFELLSPCFTHFHSYFYSHMYIWPGPVPGSHWRAGIPLRQLGPIFQLWFPFMPRGRGKGACPCVTFLLPQWNTQRCCVDTIGKHGFVTLRNKPAHRNNNYLMLFVGSFPASHMVHMVCWEESLPLPTLSLSGHLLVTSLSVTTSLR